MALIKCPECGKEISDKATNCPNCGYPISSELSDALTSNEAIALQILQNNNGMIVQSIKDYKEATGVDLKTAKAMIDSVSASNPITSSTKKKDKGKIACPKCGSSNLQVLGNKKKGFSVGKAVGGALLAGGIGTLAGFAGKKGKYEVFCMDCGHRWKTK